VSLLWMWVLNPEYGLLNGALRMAGIDGPLWFQSEQWAKPALVLMSLWGTGGTMIVFLAALQGIPGELYEAAELDGAGTLGKFVHITLPMISPAFLFNLIVGDHRLLAGVHTGLCHDRLGPARHRGGTEQCDAVRCPVSVQESIPGILHGVRRIDRVGAFLPHTRGDRPADEACQAMGLLRGGRTMRLNERSQIPLLAGITLRYALTYAALMLLGALFLIPFLWMLSVSLQDAQGMFALPFRWIPDRPRWENYGAALSAVPFGRYLFNTSVITASVLALTLFSCTLVAYGFSRLRFPGRDMLFAVCIATMMLPGQVTMIPLYMAYARLGWVDTYLPLIVPSLFGSPFYIFLLRQFFLTIPREYDEAALLDGAGRLRIYWSIVLPLARPAIATVTLFCFIGTWNDFFGPAHLSELS
jgi:multiple sugar transport system permease protein